MKTSSRTEQGRSLMPMCQLKSDYLEYRVSQYKRFDINISHANIVLMDFELTPNEFMSWDIPSVIKKVRIYVTKMRGKYGNNRMV